MQGFLHQAVRQVPAIFGSDHVFDGHEPSESWPKIRGNLWNPSCFSWQVSSRKLTWLAGNSTMNEDVFPIENWGDFPVCHVAGSVTFLYFFVNGILPPQKKTLGGGFKYFYMFTPFWEDSPFWPIFFQMGWFNHQPENLIDSHLDSSRFSDLSLKNATANLRRFWCMRLQHIKPVPGHRCDSAAGILTKGRCFICYKYLPTWKRGSCIF